MLEKYIEKYNNLDKKTTGRKDLILLEEEAVNYPKSPIAQSIKKKLSELLKNNSDKKFFIEISKKYSVSTQKQKTKKLSGLNGAVSQKNLLSKKQYHAEIEETIHFSLKLLKEQSPLKKKLLSKILPTLKKSVFMTFERKYIKKNTVAGTYKMKAFLKIGKVDYEVTLVLRKGRNGVVYYDHKSSSLNKTTEGLKGTEIVMDIPKPKEMEIVLPIATKTIATENSIVAPQTPTKQPVLEDLQQQQQQATKFVATQNTHPTPVLLDKTEETNQQQQQATTFVAKEQQNEISNKNVKTIVPGPSMIPKIENSKTNRLSLADKKKLREGKVFELYDILDKDMSEFLGDIEFKNKESVVLTIAGEQGSGKTRFAYRFMNVLGQKYKIGHASMEEHPESKLYWDKVDEYINDTALNNIDNPEVKTLSQLDKLIRDNDVIVIDSFAKLKELDRKFEVDKNLRKKYNGKLFLIVFQLTSDGSMRGGTSSQFDGDGILFVDKKPNYKDSFVYANKNRYQKRPLDELSFNIYSGKLNYNTDSDISESETIVMQYNDLII